MSTQHDNSQAGFKRHPGPRPFSQRPLVWSALFTVTHVATVGVAFLLITTPDHDYRELRGHAYMLHDQEVTRRVTEASQSGACLHCHASVVPTYRRLGIAESGAEPTVDDLRREFNWPAVMAGFEKMSTMPYDEAHIELLKTPDGTPGERESIFPGGTTTEAELERIDPHGIAGEGHPVSCIDCHDPDIMRLRITRPGFMQGIAALARSDDAVPHLPSRSHRCRDGTDPGTAAQGHLEAGLHYQ